MTNAISKKIILMIVMFLVASGGIVYSANFKGDKQQMPEAPKIEVEATESGELTNESTPSATPEIASVKPRVNATLKPIVTPTPTPKVINTPVLQAGQIDCDLRPYGAGQTFGTEDECKEKIKQMLDSGNPGVHCSKTSQGCNTMQLPEIPKQVDLSLPALSGSVDLHVDLPDYQSAIDDFNNSVNMSPIPQPCVPVGDGFNCLK